MEEFEAVYRQYFADVYRYALALSRDAHTAEEVTQETFFKALTAIDSFRGQCPLRLWLCRIARNQYLTLCRERARYTERAAKRGDGGIEEGFARQETARQLHRLLHDLPGGGGGASENVPGLPGGTGRHGRAFAGGGAPRP